MEEQSNKNITGITGECQGEKNIQARNERYNQFVEEITPKFSLLRNCVRAFWTGGAVCALGQALQKVMMYYGMTNEDAGLWTMLVLICTSIILTGFQWYGKLEKYAGAGLLVPITGFANGVASPAIEYQCEGDVFGTGCKIFTIAGPVILYGIFSSWLLGLVYWVIQFF